VFEFLALPEKKPLLENEVNDEIDNPPVGIILCADTNEVMAEYALGGLSNQIFASRYVSYIPDRE
jgi:hypothetical protein